ncbi:hypothetical protein [Vibrio tasmaniensis]|uniref:hypothetical protein n=1 Tax=Vibrio tasmaniensis TaxID=212663 RepID=UPI00107F637E|nr:hypothetical protein [Vibrio tasmaniensis]
MKASLKFITLLILVISILGCEDRNDVYANPPSHLLEQLEAYFPLSIKYVRKNEQIALTQGIPLLPQYVEIAHKIGIKYPEKIRVHYADSIPLPENESLLFQMQRLGLEAFTKKYLLQLAIFGYVEAPIEIEAYENAGKYL